MRRRWSDRASTASTDLLVALVLFSSAFAFAMQAAPTAPPEDLRHATRTQEAAVLLDQLLSVAPLDWSTDPDRATSLGLLDAGRPDLVDARRLRALRGGGQAEANGLVDYEEAKRILGVREGDFQLRVRPLPQETSSWLPDDGWRVGYVAHHSGAAAGAAARLTIASSQETLHVEVEVTNEADRAAVFTVEMALGNRTHDERAFTQMRHTPLLAPGQRHAVVVTYPALAAWSPEVTDLWFSVSDPYGKVSKDATGRLNEGWRAVSPLPTRQPVDHHLRPTAMQAYFVPGSAVGFRVDQVGALGAKTTGATARVALQAPDGREVSNLTVPLPSQPGKAYVHECGNCTAVGTYTLRVWSADMRHQQIEHVHVSADRMFLEKRTLDAVAWREIQYLDALVPSFNATRHSPGSNPEGDVFGDDVNGPSEIATVLDRYDVVVVGSDVDQDALMAAAVRHGLHDWLTRGGTLVALGHQAQNARWLEATAQVGLQPSRSPGAAAPLHPLLLWPEPLPVATYLEHGREWRAPEGAFDAAVSTEDGILLGVSRPGAFGDGTLVVSAYVPGLLTAPHAEAEGLRLLRGILAHGIAPWTVALGPDPPGDAPVAAWRRTVWAYDDDHDLRMLLAVDLLRFG